MQHAMHITQALRAADARCSLARPLSWRGGGIAFPPYAQKARVGWGTRGRWLKCCVEQQILRLPPPS